MNKPLLSSALHPAGLVMATPSSFDWQTVNHVQTLVPSASIWPSPFPASRWRSATRTCCSTSCPRTPAAWLAFLTCWPTTLRSWESSTSLCRRPHSTRWGKKKNDLYPQCLKGNLLLWIFFFFFTCQDSRCKISYIVIFLSIWEFFHLALRFFPFVLVK